MAEDYDYHINKKPGKTYITKRLDKGEENPRKFRIASKVFDSEEHHEIAIENAETVIRITPGGKQEVKAIFYEDTRGVSTIIFQKFTTETGKPHRINFSFDSEEIRTILEFINNLKFVDLSSPNKLNVTDEELTEFLLSEDQVKKLIIHNQDLVLELAKSEITKEDIIALGYRRKELSRFYSLLYDPEFFMAEKKNKGYTQDEKVWQVFFEENTWIFGYGLSFVFLSNLDNKKLEQYVKGFDLNTHGKRTDAIMKTRGLINSLCFVEIKTNKTDLLDNSGSYRSGCWSVSKELSGAISQVQGTVAMTIQDMASKLNIRDKEGNPTGEEIFTYHPKSYLVVGNLNEFKTEHGVNEDKYRSFELYRKNINSPEIITFDELYDRAKFIVEYNKS